MLAVEVVSRNVRTGRVKEYNPTMTPAKLPQSLLKVPPKTCTVGTMPIGAKMSGGAYVMLVDPELSCYLRPDQTVSDDDGWVNIVRDEHGYHVTVTLPIHWSPAEISEAERAGLIPVASVTKVK